MLSMEETFMFWVFIVLLISLLFLWYKSTTNSYIGWPQFLIYICFIVLWWTVRACYGIWKYCNYFQMNQRQKCIIVHWKWNFFALIQTKWNAEQYNLKLKDYHLIVKSFSSLLVMARKLAVMHFKQTQNVTHFMIFELVYKRYKMIMEFFHGLKNWNKSKYFHSTFCFFSHLHGKMWNIC